MVFRVRVPLTSDFTEEYVSTLTIAHESPQKNAGFNYRTKRTPALPACRESLLIVCYLLAPNPASVKFPIKTKPTVERIRPGVVVGCVSNATGRRGVRGLVMFLQSPVCGEASLTVVAVKSDQLTTVPRGNQVLV